MMMHFQSILTKLTKNEKKTLDFYPVSLSPSVVLLQ